MAQRAAWIACCTELHPFLDADAWMRESSRRAAERYPLPRVERPRVVTDPNGDDWKFDGRRFRFRYHGNVGGGWEDANYTWCPSPDLVRLWADLLAHPSEFVDDEG